MLYRVSDFSHIYKCRVSLASKQYIVPRWGLSSGVDDELMVGGYDTHVVYDPQNTSI